MRLCGFESAFWSSQLFCMLTGRGDTRNKQLDNTHNEENNTGDTHSSTQYLLAIRLICVIHRCNLLFIVLAHTLSTEEEYVLSAVCNRNKQQQHQMHMYTRETYRSVCIMLLATDWYVSHLVSCGFADVLVCWLSRTPTVLCSQWDDTQKRASSHQHHTWGEHNRTLQRCSRMPNNLLCMVASCTSMHTRVSYSPSSSSVSWACSLHSNGERKHHQQTIEQ